MSSVDPLDQLRKLAALKGEGIVDEEEYSRLKQQLLSQAAAGGGSASDAAKTTSASKSATVPLGNPVPTASRVTETQVAELHGTYIDAEELFSAIQKQRLLRTDRIKAIARRLKHLAFLTWARAKVRHVAVAPLGPILVVTFVGILFGVVFLELISNISGAMFIGGLSGGLIALLISLHVFLIPSDSAVALETSAKQAKLVTLQTDLTRDEPAFVDAGAKLNAIKHQYELLLAEFKSARNHFLSIEWRSLRGKPFEVFLKDVFEYLGYRCKLTANSGDQGVDLIVEKAGERIAIQAKAYMNSVGNEAVQQACAGMRHYGCHRCAVITNSRFTPAAVELARSNNCKLLDETQIESLIVGQAGF
jgi:hypothetical protein